MTLPLNIIFPEDPSELNRELTFMYQDIARTVNGFNETWTPVIEGGTASGAGTYSSQKGNYYKQGLMVDCWFSIVMSAHSGTGDMKVKLPFKVKNLSDVWIGEVLDSNVTYPSGTHLVLQGINNTMYARIVACGDGIASANVQVDGTAEINGHIRYMEAI